MDMSTNPILTFQHRHLSSPSYTQVLCLRPADIGRGITAELVRDAIIGGELFLSFECSGCVCDVILIFVHPPLLTFPLFLKATQRSCCSRGGGEGDTANYHSLLSLPGRTTH